MTPSDFAVKELELWENALQSQRQLEKRLRERDGHAPVELLQLLRQLREFRTRADLLLAAAVRVKCTYRESLRKPVPGPASTNSCSSPSAG